LSGKITTVRNQGWSIFFGLLALFHAINSFSEFSLGSAFGACYQDVISLILIIHGIRTYKVIWEIDEEAQLFTIQKNHKLYFHGSRSDLIAISSDLRNYFLTPAKARALKIPKQAVNESLMQLVGDNERTAP
jgi:hypothetical protein